MSEIQQEKIQLAGRPPDRPRPGSRPELSGGGPAPRPALAGLQAGGVWWGSGPQAGLGRAPGRRPLVGVRPPGRPRPGSRPAALLIPVRCLVGRPPGRPGPISRPVASGWWPASRPAQAGLQAGDQVDSHMQVCQTASFRGGVLIPLHLPREIYHDQKEEHHHCSKASNR